MKKMSIRSRNLFPFPFPFSSPSQASASSAGPYRQRSMLYYTHFKPGTYTFMERLLWRLCFLAKGFASGPVNTMAFRWCSAQDMPHTTEITFWKSGYFHPSSSRRLSWFFSSFWVQLLFGSISFPSSLLFYGSKHSRRYEHPMKLQDIITKRTT